MSGLLHLGTILVFQDHYHPPTPQILHPYPLFLISPFLTPSPNVLVPLGLMDLVHRVRDRPTAAPPPPPRSGGRRWGQGGQPGSVQLPTGPILHPLALQLYITDRKDCQ